ncbi:hypothetical protein GO730_23530 [Spirosoma sp. HMF3257]|uniref:Uncharacterized protein n=1 Tax=Spirosoma telluris TaxID=2183553 RepID=A0A327NMG1_9BACT|nr:hypothetical protein [Spirosoma telluris]RAI76382.1 hypothetical protein HMF3257_23465 [Spirosoma telluris]
MKSIAIAVLFLAGFGRCTSALTPQAQVDITDELTIRTGTRFGMCIGTHCVNDFVFNGTRVTLTQKDVRPQTQPTSKSCESTISLADWQMLKASANLDMFSKQSTSIGCPDCADGGAEYVELQIGEQKHRVTFPYGETIPGFESLVSALRSQRAAIKDCQ